MLAWFAGPFARWQFGTVSDEQRALYRAALSGTELFPGPRIDPDISTRRVVAALATGIFYHLLEFLLLPSLFALMVPSRHLGWTILGFSVFAYDYRGYGLSDGTPSEPRVYADIDGAYDYLTAQLHVPPQRIIAYGRSLGAGAAVDLAARRPVGGLILESPFLSAFRVMTRVPLFPFDKFRNADKIGRVRCPLLVMHGEADEIVPFWHGRQLFDKAPGPKIFVAIPGAHHNDFMWVAGDRYGRALRDFEALLYGH